jgi:hypothetical protein
MAEAPERRIARLQNILQQAILRDYPNPERKDCPGEDTLRKLATREYGDDYPSWDHVTHCSPCYEEFLRFVEEARRENDVRAARRKRNALIAAVCAAVLIAGGAALWRVYVAQMAPQSTLAQYEPATLDLKSESFRRGAEAPATKSESRVLPRKPLDLKIYLPVGSDRGQYQIQLEQKAGEPVLETEGVASIENGTTVVKARVDLHGLAPGAYFFGIRQPPWEWTYVPVVVE